jgi:hypothetical protein
MKKLFCVKVEILVDAETPKESLDIVSAFLEGKRELDLNYLLLDVDKDEYFESLGHLREHQRNP